MPCRCHHSQVHTNGRAGTTTGRGESEKTMTPATVELHDLPEAIRRLGGIGRTTVYELIRRGELGTVHIGNRVFIPSDEIAAFIERNRRFGADHGPGGDAA